MELSISYAAFPNCGRGWKRTAAGRGVWKGFDLFSLPDLEEWRSIRTHLHSDALLSSFGPTRTGWEVPQTRMDNSLCLARMSAAPRCIPWWTCVEGWILS